MAVRVRFPFRARAKEEDEPFGSSSLLFTCFPLPNTTTPAAEEPVTGICFVFD